MTAGAGPPAEPSRPRLSVIVPAHQAANLLGESLAALRASDLPSDAWELLVVDDGSRDETAAIAAPFADRVLRITDGPRGPAYARNVGAAAARGDILAFVDADVCVSPHTLRGFLAHLDDDPTLAGVFGAYDEFPRDTSVLSQYRNLLHRVVHVAGAGPTTTFWAGCGAMRRAVFDAVGGFDAARFPRPQVEDIDLGYRVTDRGARLLLAPELGGTHLKRWSLPGMLRTDIRDRAIPWMRVLLSRPRSLRSGTLNVVPREQVLTVVAALSLVCGAWALVVGGRGAAALAALAVAVVLAGNLPLFIAFARLRGPTFALVTAPLRLLFYWGSALGASWAVATAWFEPETIGPTAPRAGTGRVTVAALLLLAVHAGLAWALHVRASALSDDPGMYLALARAVAEGSYRELWADGAPWHAMYPPAYPAWLAAIGVTDPADVGRAIAANIALSVVTLALAARAAARHAPWMAVALLAMCAPSPMLLFLAGRMLSEPLFSAAAAFVLLLMTPAPASGRAAPATSRVGLASVVALVAAMTRSIGVVVIGVLLIEWAAARRWRSLALITAGAAVIVGGWLSWTVRAPRLDAGASYVADALVVPPASTPPTVAVPATPPGPAGILAMRVRRAVTQYPGTSLPAVLGVPLSGSTRLDNLIWLAVAVPLLLLGLLHLLRTSRPMALFLLGTAVVLALWPYVLDRFLAPILPFVVLTMLLGAQTVASFLRRPSAAPWLGGGLALAIAGVALLGAADRRARVAPCDPGADPLRAERCVSVTQRDFARAVDAAARDAADTGPWLTGAEPLAYLRTGRQAVRLAEVSSIRDPASFIAMLRSRRVERVILSHMSSAQRSIAPMLLAQCSAFVVESSISASAAVIRLTPPGESAAPRRTACAVIAQWANSPWSDASDHWRFGR